MTKPRTLYDKIWDAHLVHEAPDGTCLLYIDRHLVHEVTSPQAFEGLRMAGRKVRAPEKTLAVVDHNVPTTDRSKGIDDPESALQIATLAENARDFGIEYYHERDRRQGIVHVVGPEQGFTLPGTTIVCGDSHTSTHGAFGALAHGIGTSEVEHVLATQTLIQSEGEEHAGARRRQAARRRHRQGHHPRHHRRDRHRRRHRPRHRICRRGDQSALHGRAHDHLQHVDRGRRPRRPDRARRKDLRLHQGPPARAERRRLRGGASTDWEKLYSDEGAHFDRIVVLKADELPPIVSWGTSPEQVVSVSGRVPVPSEIADETKRKAAERSLDYMGLKGGEKITDITLDRVFIGSCTNGRIEDLREVAKVVEGRKVNENVRAMIVPGSGLVKAQAEAEGLDKIFKDAGFEWREPGCSMCLGMNPDQLAPRERCASTSNRNFEGRQGRLGRTHLVSPQMAAAAALAGRFVDIRTFH